MNHTALSAAHMVDISLRDPGGGEMIKVRLQGTKEDMDWLEKQLKSCSQVKITEPLFLESDIRSSISP